MISSSPTNLASLLPRNAVVARPNLRRVKPNNANKIASYQLEMHVVFVPDVIHDYKRLAGAASIHELFDTTDAYARLAVTDVAYLLAFHDSVVKILNLGNSLNGICELRNNQHTAVQLSQDKGLLGQIEKQYFHQYSEHHYEGMDVRPDISTEYFSLLGRNTTYVVLSPGILTSQFEPGFAPPMDELLSMACHQHLNVLRACLKPFNSNNTKESIAMCDPTGTYSAYLALLSV